MTFSVTSAAVSPTERMGWRDSFGRGNRIWSLVQHVSGLGLDEQRNWQNLLTYKWDDRLLKLKK